MHREEVYLLARWGTTLSLRSTGFDESSAQRIRWRWEGAQVILAPSMSLGRRGLLGTKLLLRTLGPWPFGLILAWSLVTWIQEPAFFARQGIPFFWPSLAALLYLMVAMAPLTWRLGLGQAATASLFRQAASVHGQVVAIWLSHLGFALLIAGMGILLGLVLDAVGGTADLTVNSIYTGLSTLRWDEVGSTAWAIGIWILVSSSLAPALALQPGPTTWVCSLWVAALVLLAWLMGVEGIGAAESSSSPFAEASLSGILATLTATLGGLGLSMASTLHRMRP